MPQTEEEKIKALEYHKIEEDEEQKNENPFFITENEVVRGVKIGKTQQKIAP